LFVTSVPDDNFVEINAFTPDEITHGYFIKQYGTLVKFIKNSKLDLQKMLGYEHKDAIMKGGDIFISKDKILASLDQYGYETKDIDHLLQSGLMPNGLYSYKKLSQKLKKAMLAADFAPEGTESDGEEEDVYGDEDQYD